MTGEQLKSIIYQARISQAEIARRLDMSQQTFNSTLSSKDVKSSIIERVAGILGISVADMYGDGEAVVKNVVNNVKDSAVAVGDNAQADNTNQDTINGLLKELQAQREQNEKLINIIINGK